MDCYLLRVIGLVWLFRLLQFPETNIVVVYILSVILTARFTDGYIWGILATVLSTCAFNIFFTHPYYTLSVDDPTYLITFAIMAITSIITSALTSKAKEMTAEAIRNGQESSALYYLTSHLADAESKDQIAGITVETVSRIMDCKAACLCADDQGKPERTFIQQKSESEQIRRCVPDPDEIQHRIENLRTDFDAGEEFYDWPIYGSESVLGVLRIPKERAEVLTDQQKKLLHSMIESTAMAMDRLRVIKERIRHSYKAVGNKAQTVFTVGGLSIDLERHQVSLDGENLHVTPMEYNLLALFFKNIGKVLTTQYIINEIYGPGYGNDTQALRALMAALRRKIEKSPAKPRYILTEIGVGYRLVDE